jgi:hypothetical protein
MPLLPFALSVNEADCYSKDVLHVLDVAHSLLRVTRSFLKIQLEGQKYFLSQVQSKLLINSHGLLPALSQVQLKLLIKNIHMDFFLQTYMSGSTPSWSRKNPIGVFFFKPKVSATLLTCDWPR